MRLLPYMLAALLTGCASAVPQAEEVTPQQASANFARPVVLAADDVRAFAAPPAGFDTVRPGVAQGSIGEFSYDSAVTGTRRNA